ILTLPKDAGHAPVCVLLHGVTHHKEAAYVRAATRLLVEQGFASIALDSQYHGDRARDDRSVRFHAYTSYTNRDASVQTALDCMRAVDYVRARDDIDPDRIGFMGFSQGAIVGATFCARDHRVGATVLFVGGGNFLQMYPPAPHDEARRRAEAISATVDPVHHVGLISPRPLLMINAERDDIVPRACTEDLFAAAGEPKRIAWYDAHHSGLPAEAFREAIAFLKDAIGTGGAAAGEGAA
ncbi:MAG: alpha/beta hydrolase, partial [Myxococcota bacterium]